jgi:D-serine deaminase-like pyridoxal phosphate-dependent protein
VAADARGPNAHLIGVPGSRARLSTPALLLDLDALERNIARMAAHCAEAGIGLRPHAKTHKSVAIARMQMAARALGICCATVGEAEAIAGAGIAGVLITSPLTTAAKIDRLVALNRDAERLMVAADNPHNVADLAAAVEAAHQSLRVVVDVNVGQDRTGVASDDDAVALAARIDEAPSLTFAGLQAYAGHLQHMVDLDERRVLAEAVSSRLGALATRLEAQGLAPGIVTGGGTGTSIIDPEARVFTELQAGSYTVMDVDYNRVPLGPDAATPYETAMFVQTAVVSANKPGFVTTDAGLKRFATDARRRVPPTPSAVTSMAG